MQKTTAVAFVAACSATLFAQPSNAERTFESAQADCADRAKSGPDGESQQLVPERPAVLGTASAGGFFGAGFRGGLAASDANPENSAFGLGWNARARADFALLSPLWIAGSVQYASAFESRSWNIEGIVGYNMRSLGHHAGVIEGDYRSVSTGMKATAGFCNYRRSDYTLFAGTKTLLFTSNPRPDAPKGAFAIQAGLQRYLFNDGGGKTFWSVAGLYDPAAGSFGAHLNLFAGLTDWVGIGTTMGALAKGDHAGFWFTADIGTIQQF